VKLDVDYFRNPKARAAGRDGRALHLASICHAGAQLTDGYLPDAGLSVLLAEAEVSRRAVSLVVDAGLWVPNGSGWVLHDYVEMNGSRHEALSRIAIERDRKARWRASKAQRRHAQEDG
jgi:hypothetical protein